MTYFRLTAARLLAQTYGSRPSPTHRDPAHMGALQLPMATSIVQILDHLRHSWVFSGADSKSAIDDAKVKLNAALVPFEVELFTSGTHSIYQPIYDKDGNVIGHETIGWLLKRNESTPTLLGNEVLDAAGNLDYGRVGCVFLGVTPV